MKTLLIVTAAAIIGASLVAAMLPGFSSPRTSPLAADAHWRDAVKLIGPDSMCGDLVGVSVALDGDLALIGSPQNEDDGLNSGAVYIFQKGRSTIRLGGDDSRGRRQIRDLSWHSAAVWP